MQRAKGFTLIEVMIVVAIIGILAAIALPAYGDYVRRGKVVEATSGLSDMRVRMEQYFQDHRTYVGACTAGTVAPTPGATPSFTFACSNLGASTYLVTATGRVQMDGFIYTLAQDGTRRTTGLGAGWSGASATSSCWVLTKSGSC